MKIVVWILVGLVALDVVIVALFTIGAAVVRRRSLSGPREPAGWGPPQAFDPAGGRVIRLRPVDADGPDEVPQPAPVADRPAPRQRSLPRRSAMVGLIALMLGAGTAIASPRAREVLTTALGAVVRTLSPTADEETAPIPTVGAGSGDVDLGLPDAPASPGGPTEVREGASSGGSAGPSLGSRPPGASPGVILPPAAPGVLTATTASSSQVDLHWADVATETGYRVQRSADALGWIVIADLDRDVTDATDSGLTSGTTYFYRLVATNIAGESPPSGVTSATTTIDPASPTTLTATAGGPTRVDLSWADVGDEIGYRIERADGAGGWITIATTGQDVTGYTDVELLPLTTYSYRVFATNGGGDSPPSDVATVTTGPDEPAAAGTADGGVGE